ncbi:MAG: hypothetical protein Q8S84_09635 [bacterium]|nr:hypothetical protein [bacterium]
MEIVYENDSDYKKVVDIIEKNGYNVQSNEIETDNVTNVLNNIVAVLIVVVLFVFSGLFDLNKYIPDTSTLSYS